jgi:hypothetical protein
VGLFKALQVFPSEVLFGSFNNYIFIMFSILVLLLLNGEGCAYYTVTIAMIQTLVFPVWGARGGA